MSKFGEGWGFRVQASGDLVSSSFGGGIHRTTRTIQIRA